MPDGMIGLIKPGSVFAGGDVWSDAARNGAFHDLVW